MIIFYTLLYKIHFVKILCMQVLQDTKCIVFLKRCDNQAICALQYVVSSSMLQILQKMIIFRTVEVYIYYKQYRLREALLKIFATMCYKIDTRQRKD